MEPGSSSKKRKARTRTGLKRGSQTRVLKAKKMPNWFVPHYDEASLFLMSAAFLLLFVTDPGMRGGSIDLATEADPLHWIGAVMFLVGLVLSIYHVFKKGPKSELSKVCLLWFAVITNVVVGYAAGKHLWEHSRGIWLVFPIMNFISAAFLAVAYRFEWIDETCISDDDAHPLEAVFGLAVVLLVWFVSRFVFDQYWALTFSICVAYATNVNLVVVRGILARREAAKAPLPDLPDVDD